MPSLPVRNSADGDSVELLTFGSLSAGGDMAILAVATRAEIKSKRDAQVLGSGKCVMDRRQARRFAMRAPVIFTWTNGDGRRQEGAGFCRNISTRGVFVVAHAAVPAVCGDMELQVILPPLSSRSHDIHLAAQGIVTRVEKLPEGAGLGIASLFGIVGDPEESSLYPLRHSRV